MEGFFYKFALSSVAAFFFGSWTLGLSALFILIGIDYVSGVMAGIKERKLSSKVGFVGLFKKVMILLVVAAAYQADQTLGTGTQIRDLTVYFYIANEILSVTENAGRLGVGMPDAMKEAIRVLQNKKEGK